MQATLHRLDKRSAPPRSPEANSDATAKQAVLRGPWIAPTAANGFSEPQVKLSWIKLGSLVGVLLSSLFLWWAIIHAVLALIQ